MSVYTIGAGVEVIGKFTDPDTKQPIDPTAVLLTVKLPDASKLNYTFGTDPEITKVAVGHYRAVLDASQNGPWHYYWNSTGSGQAAGEANFTVAAAKALL